jgi:hypothetical protein
MNINGYSFNIQHAKQFKTFDEFYEAYKESAYTHARNGREIPTNTQRELLKDAFDLLNPSEAVANKPKGKKGKDGDSNGDETAVSGVPNES